MVTAQQIRECTQDLHREIESTRLAQSMAQGNLTTQDYAALLHQLHPIHSAIESAWQQHPQLESIYPFSKYSRAAVLRNDLAHFQVAVPEKPLNATVELVQQIEAWNTEHPISLVGPMYVLEGSRFGSQLLAKSIKKILGNQASAGYHESTPPTWIQDWKQFKVLLEESVQDESQTQEIVQSARYTFQCMIRIYSQPEVTSVRS